VWPAGTARVLEYPGEVCAHVMGYPPVLLIEISRAMPGLRGLGEVPQRYVEVIVAEDGREPMLPPGPAAGESVTLIHGAGHQFPHHGGVGPQVSRLASAHVAAGVAPAQQRRPSPYRADQPAPCGAEQHRRGLPSQ
jgi:hypothetical protein